MISIEEHPARSPTAPRRATGRGDLRLGRRHASALGILVERTTRTALLVPLRAKDATSIRRAFCPRDHVQAFLNSRPRKVLSWRTLSEVFRDHLVALGT